MLDEATTITCNTELPEFPPLDSLPVGVCLLFLVTVKLVRPDLPGAGPDATKLMELRPDEKKEFTLVPGIPGVGEVVRKPFGQSNLPAK